MKIHFSITAMYNIILRITLLTSHSVTLIETTTLQYILPAELTFHPHCYIILNVSGSF